MRKQVLVIQGADYTHRSLAPYVDVSIICTKAHAETLAAKQYRHVFIVDDLADFDEIEKLNLGDFSFDFVYSFSESYQQLAAKIADTYAIAGFTEDDIRFLNDKHHVRNRLDEVGLSHCKSRSVHSKQQILNLISAFNYPFILKPDHGIGGHGVRKINSLQDLQDIDIEDLSDYVMETFIDGTEYSVETFSNLGQHHVLNVTEKIKDSNMNEVGHIIPARLTADETQRIAAYMTQINDALGIKSGVGHTEIIVTKDGHIELVETHIRMGGGMMGVLMNNVYHCDVVACWGDMIADNKSVSHLPDWNGSYSSIMSVFPTKRGVITRLDVPNDDSFKTIIRKQVGDTVDDIDNQNRILQMMGTDTDPDRLKMNLLHRLKQVIVEIG
ncbi:ATP-grasp domain-containing protein [Lactiplantibacillus pentosus]|uniref:ATP-grasp domain-containing protein n=1 Tax=Lactiplantibacillus pentosus TaxID=1589 RepID=UPI002091DA61|nr:ATP-grasp domain-containing protein [Lactiplantibacillus pentosus]WMB62587.1 ATP-grasp domain-containing protein [Lactiplantibacillus pentosus]